MNKKIIVLVNGSRNYIDKNFIEEKIYKILNNYIENNYDIIIREGDAKGVDKIAGQIALESNWNLEVFKAIWKDNHNNYNPKAGFERNIKMVEGIDNYNNKKGVFDIMISFVLNNSHGTLHCINYAKNKYPNKLYYRFNIDDK